MNTPALPVQALLASVLLAGALLAVRCARKRASAAVRHLILITGLVAVLVLPIASCLESRFEAVRRIRTSLVLVVTSDTSQSFAAATRALPSVPEWTTLLVTLWIAGVLSSLITLLFALLRRRRSGTAAPRSMEALARDVAARLGIRRQIRVEESDVLLVPETRGVVHPVLTMPRTARDWPDERLAVVLMHELIHVRRNDWLTGLIAEISLALHWFNPLAWIAVRALCKSASWLATMPY